MLQKKETVILNDTLLMEYWENAQEIISEFNEYGGGSPEKEDDAYEWLNEISELVEKGNISHNYKIQKVIKYIIYLIKFIFFTLVLNYNKDL